jgi:RNA recognition motif. (a.k.a. RRM, RBD, or RNP domain)
MDSSAKLGLSLDDLIKTDKDTKTAVRATFRKGKKFTGKRVKKVSTESGMEIDGEKKEKLKKVKKTAIRKGGKDSESKKPVRKSSDSGKTVRTKVILKPKKAVERNAVKVTNIPYDVTWRDLKEAFSKLADVKRCDIEEKGTALIEWKNHQSIFCLKPRFPKTSLCSLNQIKSKQKTSFN